MKYRIREGIVLTSVCGVSILVPLRVLREEKLPIRRVPRGIAMAIGMFSKNLSEQGIVDFLSLLGKMPDKVLVKEKLYEALETLCEAGYLVKVDEEPQS